MIFKKIADDQTEYEKTVIDMKTIWDNSPASIRRNHYLREIFELCLKKDDSIYPTPKSKKHKMEIIEK